MDEHRIEDALRAGPPDERPHRQGALARGLAARSSRPDESTFQVRLRPQSSPAATLFLAAAVGIVVLALVLAGVGTSPTRSHVPASLGPSESGPSLGSPTSTPTAEGAPVALVDRWVGTVREIPGLDKPATRAFLDIRGAGFRFDAGPGQPGSLFASAVTQAGPDVLRLTALAPTQGCTPFDEGTYRWSLSPGGTTLTLDMLTDACSARGAALPGTWTHTACREAARDCLGPLEPGTYRSTEFDPFHTATSGQLSYSVPETWANAADNALNYAIRPAADHLADPGFDGNDTVSGIYLWAGTLAADQPPDCSALPAQGVAATAGAIADHIAGLSGLDVGDRGTIVVDNRSARVLDLSLDPAYRTACPWSGGAPFRSLVLFADAGADGGVQGLAPGERARILFVDVAPGRVVSIWIDGPATRFDELVRDATPIIESFRFESRPSTP